LVLAYGSIIVKEVFVPSKHLGFRLAGLDTKSNPSKQRVLDLNNATSYGTMEEESRHGA
jgi:hypothetical protein